MLMTCADTPMQFAALSPRTWDLSATLAHLTGMRPSRAPGGASATDAVASESRHVFLTAGEVIARYRWGRTKGYELLRSPNFPRSVAGRYRLDLLIAWEEEQLAVEAREAAQRPAGPPAKRHSKRRSTPDGY